MNRRLKNYVFILFFTLIFSLNYCSFAAQDFTLPIPPKKILSIDGGGTRGIWSLEIIHAIENELDEPITSYVDCFTGASMGGIISLGYAAGYPTHSLMDLITLNKDRIFTPKAAWWNIWGRLAQEKYLTYPIESIAKEFFGELTFSDLKTPVIIPTSNITKMRPHLFTSYQPEDCCQSLWFAARSTSAAPTYFEPTNYNGDALVDGALVTNNPALLSALYLNSLYRDREDFLRNLSVVSIGTGTYDSGFSYENSRNMGVVKWAPPISTVLMDMNSIVDDYQMGALLPADSYVRLNAEFDQEMPLDAVKPEQIQALKRSAQRFIQENPHLIRKAASLLTRRL